MAIWDLHAKLGLFWDQIWTLVPFGTKSQIWDFNRAPAGNKLTGSNKLLVFALGEGIDENYNNVRIVVEKLKLHELHCCFASDMKLINVLISPFFQACLPLL